MCVCARVLLGHQIWLFSFRIFGITWAAAFPFAVPTSLLSLTDRRNPSSQTAIMWRELWLPPDPLPSPPSSHPHPDNLSVAPRQCPACGWETSRRGRLLGELGRGAAGIRSKIPAAAFLTWSNCFFDIVLTVEPSALKGAFVLGRVGSRPAITPWFLCRRACGDACDGVSDVLRGAVSHLV